MLIRLTSYQLATLTSCAHLATKTLFRLPNWIPFSSFFFSLPCNSSSPYFFHDPSLRVRASSPAKPVGLGWNEANKPPAFNLSYGSVHDWHVEIAKIHEQPNSDLVTAHPLDKYDLVLHVIRGHSHEKKRCPDFQPTTFGGRTSANRALQENLPVFNLLKLDDKYVISRMEEALVTLGKVYASAPTHVAVDNFANRLDLVTDRVTTRLNQGKQDAGRSHRRKIAAILHLLQHPHDGDNSSRSVGRMETTKWKLHLSLVYWLLMLIGSSGLQPPTPSRAKAKNGNEVKFQVEGSTGEKHWTGAMMLRNVYKKLYDARRFIYLDFNQSEIGGEAQGFQGHV
ncbi:hypothetical protein BKA56DRAFT_620905 [Ilyonectria sp. MPI-CAGE-AT-0026]|nr:hypothetical protein BKA56DRAFT_620905 [Ilyonectria sp. MPI-CAGE-AT-0026]